MTYLLSDVHRGAVLRAGNGLSDRSNLPTSKESTSYFATTRSRRGQANKPSDILAGLR